MKLIRKWKIRQSAPIKDLVLKENNEKKIINSDEISKLIKAFPKDG